MKSSIESARLRQQLRIMALNNANIVAQIRRDLKNGVVRAGEQGSERVSHGVGSHPRATLTEHVFSKRTGKIVAITILAVLILGMKHKGFSQTVVIANEGQELSSQRDAALLAILKLDRGRFPKVQNTGVHVEPKGPGFDNLQSTKSGVESAEQDIFQIFPFTFSDQARNQLGRTEVFTGSGIGRGYAESRAWVFSDGLFNVPAPVEEAANCHQVPVRGGGGSLSEPEVVIFSHPVGRHVTGSQASARIGEGEQNVVFRAHGGPGPSPALPCLSPQPHVVNEAVNGVADQAAGFEFRRVTEPGGVDDCLTQISRFQGNVMPLFFLLNGQPIDVAAFVNPSRKSLGGVHQIPCRISSVTLLKRIGVTSASIEESFLGVYGARTRNLRRDRARDFIGTVTLSLSHSGGPA